jgi:homoserine dehydrogenase
MTPASVNIALVGCGTVGSGVLALFQKNRGLLEAKAGAPMRLTWVCSRGRPPAAAAGIRHTTEWRRVVADPDVHIVVELIGGYEPARTLVLAALEAGKHVATANKALLSRHWAEIFTAARRQRALVYFEAAVGGGIPVIQGLNEGLAANHIQKIYGILNGTTNYILTRMAEDGLDFALALKEAQKAGFAEADPSFDIDGVDAAQKLAILASLAGDTWVRPDEVATEGIRRLNVWDVAFARRRLGLATKLLGIAHLERGRFSARVHPALIPAEHPFANVAREYNAVFVHGDAAGDVMFYGRGAGQMPAASAVVSDVMYLARQVANGTAGQTPYVLYHEKKKWLPIPVDRVVSRHYLRFSTADRPGVLARITSLLAQNRISISSVHQDETGGGRRPVPVVIVTHRAPRGAVRAALGEAGRLSGMLKEAVHLPIEDLA